MDSATLAYPLCIQGDTINNPNGCVGSEGIKGVTYKDNNLNCLQDSGDQNLINIPIKLYDNNNNLLAQLVSFYNGVYNFVKPPGTYLVSIDTTGIAFTTHCTHPGVDSIVTTTTANPLATDVNFPISCKPGFDVGIQSVVATGMVFPGQQHTVKIVAGDMSQWFNLNCCAGLSGQLTVTVNGPVTYLSPATGALTPLVNGNVFTYTISDFGNINISQDFALLFKTDTTAQAGDVICFTATITPTTGDNYINNNVYQYCYHVVNSLDPNMKEVYPDNVSSGFEDYFTYTIHFQNTGNAPAINIRIVDTLSGNLDLGSFKVVNFSHNNIASLYGRVLTFSFPNIFLPDSTTDEPGSKGFVQYKIKPKGNLIAGAQIKNTAYIYFDYNAPVETNTTINSFGSLSVEEHSKAFQMNIYPNPTSNHIIIENPEASPTTYNLSLTNIQGQRLLSERVVIDKTHTLDLTTLPNGIYIFNLQNEKENYVSKVVVRW